MTGCSTRKVNGWADHPDCGSNPMTGQSSHHGAHIEIAWGSTSLHGDIDSETLSHFGEAFDCTEAHVVESSDIGEHLAPNSHVHYYIHVPDGDESTYQYEERNVEIDLQFHCQFQEEEVARDISSFLTLL